MKEKGTTKSKFDRQKELPGGQKKSTTTTEKQLAFLAKQAQELKMGYE